MITDQQLEAFERDGAVTIDSPFTESQITAASEAFDRLLARPPYPSNVLKYRSSLNQITEPVLIELIQHPIMEEVAKRALRADEVKLFRPSIKQTYPAPNTSFQYRLHTDIRLSHRDLQAVPRRMPCYMLIWISDVTPQLAPLMIRPGSHRQIADAIEADPVYLPQTNHTGLVRIEDYENIEDARSAPTEVAWLEDDFPDLDYRKPVPILARAGQVTIWNPANIHGASTNISNTSRKVMFVNFLPRGVKIGYAKDVTGKQQKFMNELSGLLRPERRHLTRV